MTKEEFIKNSTIIQKALKNCSYRDISYLEYISNGGKLDSIDLRFKQMIKHMCSGLNLFELIRLKKAFNTLIKL